MSRNGPAIGLVVVGLLGWSALTLGDDYGVTDCGDGAYNCENCSADPAFVQRDARDPVTVAKLRRIRAIRRAVAASFSRVERSGARSEPEAAARDIVLRIDLNGGWWIGERRPVHAARLAELLGQPVEDQRAEK